MGAHIGSNKAAFEPEFALHGIGTKQKNRELQLEKLELARQKEELSRQQEREAEQTRKSLQAERVKAELAHADERQQLMIKLKGVESDEAKKQEQELLQKHAREMSDLKEILQGDLQGMLLRQKMQTAELTKREEDLSRPEKELL